MSADIVSLHDNLSPQTILTRAANRDSLKDAKAVIVLVQDRDGRWGVEYSRMPVKDLVFAERVFGLSVAADINAMGEPVE